MNREVIRTIKFTLFSISAGLIETLAFELLTKVFNITYYPSYLTALILSVLWNFTLNRNYTFKSANNIKIAMLQVFLFYLVFTPVSTILGNTLVSSYNWNEDIVLIISMLLNFVTEYLYDRFVVFRKSIDTKN